MNQWTESEDQIGVVLLAAGYGTRLARDIANAPSFSRLATTPKPLLPLGGRVLLSHWVHQFENVPQLTAIVVVTNDAHRELYENWAKSVSCPNNAFVKVVTDGTISNETRAGAIAGMRIGIDALPPTMKIAILVAGDTLIPTFDANALISQFRDAKADAAICAYTLQDPADCVRRGMLRVAEDNFATELVEKPASVADSPSNLSCAPIYFLRERVRDSFEKFLVQHADKPLKLRDAPGFWVRWIIPRLRTYVLRVADRIDIGGLSHYRDALSRFANTGARVGQLRVLPRAVNEPAIGRAVPRAGFLGNPSDGYGGKTIAIALASEGFAEVMAVPSNKFSIISNPVHELPYEFDNIHQLSKCIFKYGVRYGARQLLVAATAAFARILNYSTTGNTVNGENMEGLPSSNLNCQLTYSTTIPARLGLAGSSALILATFRALARFYNTSLYQLDSSIESWPLRLLQVERDMLGIPGGLQDRVAQVYQGCIFMDFSTEPPVYQRLDYSRLPPLWIAYRSVESVGECSGKVHSDLGVRYRARDEKVLAGMAKLGTLADKGRSALLENLETIATLFQQNFAMRLKLVGELAVGDDNISAVRTAEKAGFSAKLCGSGGSIICVPNPVRQLSEEETKRAEELFSEAGLVLRRAKIVPGVVWGEE